MRFAPNNIRPNNRFAPNEFAQIKFSTIEFNTKIFPKNKNRANAIATNTLIGRMRFAPTMINLQKKDDGK